MEKLGNREINWEKGKVRDSEVGEFGRPRHEEFRSRKRLSRGRKIKWQRGKLGGREVRDREIARSHHERLRSEKESSHRERGEFRQKQETERFGRCRHSEERGEEVRQKQETETERFGRRREKSRFDHREERGEVRQKQETDRFGRRREKSEERGEVLQKQETDRFGRRREKSRFHGKVLQKQETDRFGRRREKSRFHHRQERGKVRQKQETDRFGRRWEKSRFHHREERGEVRQETDRFGRRWEKSRFHQETERFGFGRCREKSRFPRHRREEIAHEKKRKRRGISLHHEKRYKLSNERSQPSRWEEEEEDSLRSSGSREKSEKVVERSTPSSLAGDDGESGSDSGFSGESDPFGWAKFIEPNYKPPENWHTYFGEPTPISVRLWSPGPHHHRPTRSYTRRERGIDYKHWSIFINPSVISTYQGRKEKVLFFLKMLAQLLGSNDKALKCLYAVRRSGFSCRLPGKVALRFYSFKGVVWSVGIEKYIFCEGQFQKGKYCEDWERFPLHGVDKLSYYRGELDRAIALDNN